MKKIYNAPKIVQVKVEKTSILYSSKDETGVTDDFCAKQAYTFFDEDEEEEEPDTICWEIDKCDSWGVDF